MHFWIEKVIENESQNGPQKRLKPVSTWNGKRGFVRDIACVWMCSVCLYFTMFTVFVAADYDMVAHAASRAATRLSHVAESPKRKPRQAVMLT